MLYALLMAAFDDVLGQLRQWKPGEDSPVPPATLYDDLASAYQALVDQRDGAKVILSEKESLLSARDAEISRLKGENYDLASRIGFTDDKTQDKAPEENRPSGIDGLFVRRTKK